MKLDQYDTNAIEDLGLALCIADMNDQPDAPEGGWTPSSLCKQMLKIDIANTVIKYQDTILTRLLTAYPTASADNKTVVLTKLGMTAYAALPVDQLIPLLASVDIGQKAFKALSGADMSAIVTALS